MVEKINRRSLVILADLIKAKRPLPVGRIAKRNGISWKTADTHIKKMEQRGLIDCTHGKRRNYCKVNPQVLKNLNK